MRLSIARRFDGARRALASRPASHRLVPPAQLRATIAEGPGIMRAGVIGQNLAIFFPLFFVALWLTVTTVLALLSGWFRLMEQYPDQSIEPILRLRGQSGSMGSGVGMQGILVLSVCPTGLRVGMMRIFGPFCGDFFVPWESIAVIRKRIQFWPVAKLQFGNPVVGTLSISAGTADKIARAAMGHWPEAGPFPEEKRGDTFRRLLGQWAVITSFAALFFILVPLAVAPSGARPPILVAILFPAIVVGVATIVRFLAGRG
jgi:hypothetical protein